MTVETIARDLLNSKLLGRAVWRVVTDCKPRGVELFLWELAFHGTGDEIDGAVRALVLEPTVLYVSFLLHTDSPIVRRNIDILHKACATCRDFEEVRFFVGVADTILSMEESGHSTPAEKTA